jgi:hypothetical protein
VNCVGAARRGGDIFSSLTTAAPTHAQIFVTFSLPGTFKPNSITVQVSDLSTSPVTTMVLNIVVRAARGRPAADRPAAA